MPRAFRAALFALLLVGCHESPDEPVAAPPVISSFAAVANPNQVLSLRATLVARNADSARLVFASSNDNRLTTPYVRVRDGQASLVALGLAAGTTYSVAAEAIGPGGTATSDPIVASTGQLPAYLRNVHLDATGTFGPGYLLMTVNQTDVGTTIVAFDGGGAIAWYRTFSGAVRGTETKQQPNGDFTIYVDTIAGSPGLGSQYGAYVEVNPAGDIVRRFTAPSPWITDNHELLLTFRDTVLEAAHFYGESDRTVLDTLGVLRKTGAHALLRLSPTGVTQFVWDAWDNVDQHEAIETEAPLQFDHPNAIDIDADGNYITSWRTLGQVMKIDSRTGSVIWRLGGKRNDFTFVNDSLGGFSAQHCVRALPNGNILVYDNGTRHPTQETRVVEYRLDLTAKTATLVWEYRHTPAIYTAYQGSAQRLADGTTLIGYSSAATVTLVDQSKRAQWEGHVLVDGTPPTFYRAIKVRSLYRFEKP